MRFFLITCVAALSVGVATMAQADEPGRVIRQRPQPQYEQQPEDQQYEQEPQQEVYQAPGFIPQQQYYCPGQCAPMPLQGVQLQPVPVPVPVAQFCARCQLRMLGPGVAQILAERPFSPPEILFMGALFNAQQLINYYVQSGICEPGPVAAPVVGAPIYGGPGYYPRHPHYSGPRYAPGPYRRAPIYYGGPRPPSYRGGVIAR